MCKEWLQQLVYLRGCDVHFVSAKNQHLKLKEEQKRAVEAICHGDDVFVSLPGFGKKHMFSCPFFLVFVLLLQ